MDAGHLTASVVALDSTGTRVLLLRHPRFGRWGPLGGHAEGGEPVVEAARRELREESGLSARRLVEPHIAVLQDVTECGESQEPVRHVDHVYAVEADADVELTTAEPGLLGWFGVDALPVPHVPGLRGLVREARRALGHLG